MLVADVPLDRVGSLGISGVLVEEASKYLVFGAKQASQHASGGGDVVVGCRRRVEIVSMKASSAEVCPFCCLWLPRQGVHPRRLCREDQRRSSWGLPKLLAAPFTASFTTSTASSTAFFTASFSQSGKKRDKI
jgi:hypothetical protein